MSLVLECLECPLFGVSFIGGSITEMLSRMLSAILQDPLTPIRLLRVLLSCYAFGALCTLCKILYVCPRRPGKTYHEGHVHIRGHRQENVGSHLVYG